MSKKKTKRKPPALRPPPLSGLDKAVYVCLFLADLALLFGMLFGLLALQRKIAYADPTVMSSAARGTVFWAAPFLTVFAIITMGGLFTAYGDKKPIFGKKGIPYGSVHYAPVYPLFMKGRPKPYIRPSEKRYRRFMIRFAVGALAVTLLLTPLALYGRNSLREDMSITVYSVFDQEKRRYEQEDIDTVTFTIRRRSKGYRLILRAEIRTKDGRRYDYGSTGDLDTLLYIKSHVSPSQVRYKWENRLEELIRRENFTPDEAAKVRMLFEKS